MIRLWTELTVCIFLVVELSLSSCLTPPPPEKNGLSLENKLLEADQSFREISWSSGRTDEELICS